MRPFGYARATDTREALDALAATPGTLPLGGGTNLVDLMRLGVAAPPALVDVTRLPFGGVEETADGGSRIGAGVRNSDLAAHLVVDLVDHR